MIVLNEEAFIATALKNVSPFVDEIIVVDGGSKDGTLQIVSKFKKVKVIQNAWPENFSEQRNISLKHATKDWVLVMDADEVYEKKLLVELQKLSKNNIGIDAFAFPRKNYIDGKLTSAYPDRQTRFFMRKPKIKYERKLHEQVVGFRRIASPMDLHIIHKKTSTRQAVQDKRYKAMEK